MLHGLCVVIECYGLGILLMSVYSMRLPERLSGASIGLGPLVDGDMRLPPADVAASSGEQNAHPGGHTSASQAAP